MDVQSEKTKHPAVGPEEWDGPSKKYLHIVVIDRTNESPASNLARKSALIKKKTSNSFNNHQILAWLKLFLRIFMYYYNKTTFAVCGLLFFLDVYSRILLIFTFL